MRDIMKVFKRNKTISKELGNSILALEKVINADGSFWERHKDNPEKLETLRKLNADGNMINEEGFVEIKTFVDLGIISQLGLKAADGQNVVDIQSFAGLLRLSRVRQESIIKYAKKLAKGEKK